MVWPILPGEELPTVRDLALEWDCAPGTVQRAYHELARQGLVSSRRGQGTHVAELPTLEPDGPMRRATLINQVEAFVLRLMQTGYKQQEIEGAFRLAMDRWKTVARDVPTRPLGRLNFVGSHDPVISLLNEFLLQEGENWGMRLSFAGSLGGLMALARGEADLAGCHLWDRESDCYNLPFVRKLLPGRKIALLRMVNRRLGLMVRMGNPLEIQDLEDLRRQDIRLVNRQSGAGTRVWLDEALGQLDISPMAVSWSTRLARAASVCS